MAGYTVERIRADSIFWEEITLKRLQLQRKGVLPEPVFPHYKHRQLICEPILEQSYLFHITPMWLFGIGCMCTSISLFDILPVQRCGWTANFCWNLQAVYALWLYIAIFVKKGQAAHLARVGWRSTQTEDRIFSLSKCRRQQEFFHVEAFKMSNINCLAYNHRDTSFLALAKRRKHVLPWCCRGSLCVGTDG